MKFIFIGLIKLYRLLISPMLGANKCRYQPTCSQYTMDAINEWGVFRGVLMGAKRLARCHPWSTHEHYDPVLKKKNKI